MTPARKDVRARIRQFLASTFLLSDGPFPFADDASLLGEGVVDSTGVLELIQFLEGDLGVSVADTEAVPDNLDSIDRLVAFVERKQVAEQVF